MPENTLYSIHPAPPTQNPTGRNPQSYLHEAGNLHPQLVNQLPNLHLPPGGLLDRHMVRRICLNPNVHVLAAYAVAMAWGGQDMGYFRTSVGSANLPGLLLQLRGSVNNRAADFAITQTAAAAIHGLGISYYTKLLYFFRPSPDAYILDQWTVKSARLLFHPCGVHMRGDLPDPNTTPVQYEWFCAELDSLAPRLWPANPGASGEAAEVAIFDEGRGRGEWRKYVVAHFENERVARAVRSGAQCLTTHQDFSDGWLVIRVQEGLEIHATGVRAGDGKTLRVLLARIRELKPRRVFFPAGTVALPDWFLAACESLGVEVVYCEFGEGPGRNPEGDAGQDPVAGPVAGPAGAVDLMRDEIRRQHEMRRAEMPGIPSVRYQGPPHRLSTGMTHNHPAQGGTFQYHLNANSVRVDVFFGNPNNYAALNHRKGGNHQFPEAQARGNGTRAVSVQVPNHPAGVVATAGNAVDAMVRLWNGLM